MKKTKKKKVKSIADLRSIRQAAVKQLNQTIDEYRAGEADMEKLEEEMEFIKSIDDIRERKRKRDQGRK